jgi:predicted O-methyltransferase YrrM
MGLLQLRGRRGLRYRALPLVELGFAAIGRPWREFYAWMLDRQERGTTIESILDRPRAPAGRGRGLYDVARGDYHLAFLRRHGLEPHHRVVDFGCGYGRSAIPLLRYLDPGRYIGVEISNQRLRLARDFVRHEELEDRRPRFIHSFDTAMRYLEDGGTDYFWAQSVFTHMPPKDSRAALAALARVLAPDGLGLLDYSVASGDSLEKLNIKGFYYPESLFEGLVSDAGLQFAVADGYWDDDLTDAEQRAMARKGETSLDSRMLKVSRV